MRIYSRAESDIGPLYAIESGRGITQSGTPSERMLRDGEAFNAQETTKYPFQ